MEKLTRPKTVNLTAFQFGTDLAARNTLYQGRKTKFPPIGSSARRSAADWDPTGSRQGSRRPAPSAFARSVEIQRNYWTDPPSHSFGEYQDTYETLGYQQPDESPAADEASVGAWPQSYQLPGYHSLPVMQPMRVMNPYGKTLVSGRVATAAPGPADQLHYRTGRNGSNWRHVTQCTGNLGNHIVFINGRVKSEDNDNFPPHGYPAGMLPATSGPQPPVSSAFPPARPFAGTRTSGLYTSKALLRARGGNKYWFEDKKPPKSNWKYAFGSKGSGLGVAGTPLAGGF